MITLVGIISAATLHFSYMQDLRRDLHKHPELAFEEFRTASTVERELRQLMGMKIRTGVGKTGIVAQLDGKQGPGKVIMLRFDMDALPIHDENTTEYASIVPNVSHKCGHDGHVAVGLGVARILHELREEFSGSVKFVFQPGEEGANGAVSMIADGALENPKPDYALAFHVWNEKPVGWLGVVGGPMMAGVDDFKVLIKGLGGHGAIPDLAIDPIVAGAQIISAIQTIVSRNISPLKSAVISVTKLEAGNAYNVIPQSLEMLGTIRFFDNQVRDVVVNRFETIVTKIANALSCEAEIKVTHLASPVINDASVTQKIIPIAKELFPNIIIDTTFKTMGAEDMSAFLEQIPGCLIMVGSSNSAKGLDYGHHHPKFDFDEDALTYAASLLTATTIKLLG